MKVTKKEETFTEYKEIEVREPLVADVIEAQKVSGQTSGRKYEAALVAQCAKFDGEKLVMEDIMRIPERFFFEIYDQVLGGDLKKLVDLLLSSQDTQGLDQKQS